MLAAAVGVVVVAAAAVVAAVAAAVVGSAVEECVDYSVVAVVDDSEADCCRKGHLGSNH